MSLIPALYYATLLLSIVLADPGQPRNVYYYNEIAFLPLVAMIATVLFQKEFGGSLMEIMSTFPLSYTGLLLRKLGVALAAAVLLHGGWVWVYLIKFHALPSTIFLYNGGEAYRTEHAEWLQLLGQALPEYVLMSALTMFGMIASRGLYGGILAGFALWLLEAMTRGSLMGGFALYTTHIPAYMSFAGNRTMLLGIAAGLIGLGAWWMNRRHRWIVREDTEA